MKRNRFYLGKNLAVLVLTIVTLLFFIPLVAEAASTIYYKTTGTATNNSIEISNNVLKTAKSNATCKSSSFSINTGIASAYDTHIYHFKAPSTGYYSFHTTGSLDTVIKVYKENKALGITTGFKDCGLNDDGSMADTNSRNANLVVKLTKGQSYYVCVRGYAKKTGRYTLIVEPNQDKMLFSKYGYTKWTCNDGLTSLLDGTVMGTTSLNYLSKDDVLFLYWSLIPACKGITGKDIDYLYSSYNQSYSQFISDVNYLSSFLNLDYVSSISVANIGRVLEIVYGECTMDDLELMNMLTETCGVLYDGTKWTIDSGLLIQEYYNSKMLTFVTYYYKPYNENNLLRTGEKGEKGTWSK